MLFVVKKIESYYRGQHEVFTKYIRGGSKQDVIDYIHKTYGHPGCLRYDEIETHYTFERIKIESAKRG